MLRILQVVPNMQAGGIETWLMNQYRCLDRSQIQYDFLVHYKQRFFYDDEIESLGGHIYRSSVREDNNLFAYLNFLNLFFKEHPEYQIVHGHMPSLSFFYMGAAKKAGVPVRINHSHNSSFNHTLKGYMEYLLTKLVKINSNYFFACSEKAGIYMYGKSKYTVIHNAIDTNKFRYVQKVRDEMRKALNIDDKFVLGHIGRFNLQKNHKFLLNMFHEYSNYNQNAVLLLIGTGELKDEIVKLVDQLNLSEKVYMLGVRKDTDKLYQALDVCLLPSLFEGLPVVGIEAQASGVPFLVSDKVTREAKLLDSTIYLPIDRGYQPWIDALKNLPSINREQAYKIVKDKGYDIQTETQRIVNLYQSLLK